MQITGTSEQSAETPVVFRGIDYLEIYVANVHQAMHFYRTAYGFAPIAQAGLETGARDQVSVMLEQNDIRLVLTGALTPDGPIAEHVRLHGDSVKDVALLVDDARHSFATATRRGAQPVMEPTVIEDENGSIIKATVGTFGATVHSFIQRVTHRGPFLPSYRPYNLPALALEPHLMGIDHLAICVEPGKLEYWIEFYQQVLGFQKTHHEDIRTEYSAMNSQVVEDPTGLIKLPIMEPAPARRKSQIEEYLTFHCGAGVQHVAFSSNNILQTVETLRLGGTDFLMPPASYYEALERRVGKIKEELSTLRQCNLLVDHDRYGYLIQAFTKPVHTRPTLFMEVIQRNNSQGFGGGNIKALFEAVELEQLRRGNL